ncbi:MAG: diguanylate cyclase, partial [Candidatus Omnitrophica bacterium]|nr:diguanylate cyclase [Candidatus Omnitrophota bacterium]
MDNEQVPVPQDAKDIRFKAPTFIDPLTGLFNQYYLYQFLPEEMKKARLSNYPLTVFMIDLDGFKAVNDTYGHLCGDAVLKGLAVLLKKFVRQTDMVIRYAGDEFTILLPAADQARAEGLAKRLLEEIEKNIFKGKDNEEIRLTISLGLATYPEDAEEVDKLIDSADKALYLSKGRGKNRISQAKEVTLEAASYMIAMDSFPCVKFIDRQAEIEKLKQIFDNAVVQSNQLQLAFISGEAGMGKSRLLAEVSNYAQDRAALINCRCSSTHTQDPYYLFAKGISNYIDKVGIDAPLVQAIFSKIPAAELGGLSRLVPAIGYIVKKPGDDLEKNDRNARFLLFKAFLDFLIELNNISAVLIAFDDIQWADKASLELLRYLTQQERNKRMLILCSFTEDKSKEMTSNANLKKLWEDIHFDTNFTHIKIKNFPLADASLMIESIFPGISAEKDFYELIYNATGGNPSFIEEMLKSLVENAVIFYQDNHWQIKKDLSRQDVPFSIEEVIKKRLKNLDEETKEAILQAAVIGEDFSLDILKKIDNKDEGMMLELLNRAKKMRLLNELEHKGDFGFVNKHVQNLLYNELNEEQRRLLHYKIGESIAKEHKDNPYNVAGEVVYHLAQAPDKDKAMEYTTQFSQKITQMFDPAEALEYLDELTKEVLIEAGEEKGPAAVLNEQMLREVMKFIRIVQGAVKTFQLYPPGVMRNNIIKEAYTVINTLCQSVESIDLSEVEKGLVINDKRISPREIEQANIDKFLAMMMEYNLKTVSFVKGVTVDDLSKFIECISRPYPQIRDKGGWPQITKQGNIRGIKTEELNAGQQASAKGAGAKEFAGKKKLQNVMLMEFLLGKIEQGASIDGKAILQNMRSEPQKFAQTIAEAADAAVKQGQAEGQINAVASSIEKINIQI